MCNHKAVGKWRLFWRRFVKTFLSIFFTAEIIGLVTVGPDATLSYDIQCLAGTDEPCQHTVWGRLVICVTCAWAAAHFGWGRFGAGWLIEIVRRSRRRNQEVPS